MELRAAEWRCGARRIPYTLRLSARARTFGMWISPQTGLVVTAPVVTYDAGGLERFLQRHESWIVKHLDRYARVASRIPLSWPYGQTLLFRGARCRVVLESRKRTPAQVVEADGALVVQMRQPSVDGARRVLGQWYRGQAARWCERRAAEFGQMLGVRWKRIRIGDQRRRWGSCSVRGCLSFNYRLVMAPPEALDYVVLHELAHLIELSHSPRFWAIVAQHCPDYRRLVRWLNTYGPYLGI